MKVGDKVETIDDAIIGTVTKVDGDTVFVEGEDGFEFQFSKNELIKLNKDESINLGSFSNQRIQEIAKEKEGKPKRKSSEAKSKKRHRPTFVVDLHVHQLTDSTKGMTNFDMLNLQLDTARGQLEFAIRQRMPKMVFIHGVGEGVLKQELHTVLRRYNNVDFYDADYREYGLGATEVKIFQNVEP
ncbi:Smr domain-containing protein [Winogradskyella wandonensis]|uniref:Smr domain-containing protein n=1 Tax=Winogradskyella wandonensis TaxID=1442586 RepID=A0A4R1KV80_9FLAO|nr:Smr/MutS family protein [Winogradskyella wandonensis]TCK69054.1 Smr domain-containing protein [Winogradskyella wandonensis]